MASEQRNVEVAVVGGGLIGLAVAWRLAGRNVPVCVIDEAPGSGASWAAAGMLAPVGEVHHGEEALLALNLAAAARWPSYAAELEEASGLGCGYRQTGTLAVGFDQDDRALLEDLAAYQRSLALDVELLDARQCRQLEPLLAPQVRGGLYVAGDHSVDNRRVVACLLAACERSGVAMVRERAEALEIEHDAVAGIRLASQERITAPTVVLAAGCRSASLAGVPTSELPVRPVKGQILRLRMPPSYGPLLSRTLRGVARGRSIYLVPREDGELVVGATVEELGFDTTVTAGAVYELLRSATALLPMAGECELAEASAGLRPGTPDNAPMLGPFGPSGLVVATGHYRNGVLLSPVSADAIADYVTSGHLGELVAAFQPARFKTAAAR